MQQGYLDNQKWSAKKFQTIAKISLDHLIDEDQCEKLKFNPWHTASELKPLGSVSRARSHIYDHLSTYRQTL